jgi:enterochelin esterase-like enzyme
MIMGLMTSCAVASPQPMVTQTLQVLDTAAPTAQPTPEPSPTQAGCQDIAGKVERMQVPSAFLASPMWVSVYTPPCYSTQPEQAYPVLYLLHGQNMDDNYWQTLGATRLADEAILAGQRPFLMVMPFEERNFDPPTETGFAEALVQELIPWVDAQYPTCTERACRAIGGISRGGGWAVHVAVRNFDLFGAVGAHSMGAIGADWFKLVELRGIHGAPEFPRYYVDRGEDDYLKDGIDQLEAVLTSGGIAHEYVVSPGAHDGNYWQAHVQDYMQWYMQGWQ